MNMQFWKRSAEDTAARLGGDGRRIPLWMKIIAAVAGVVCFVLVAGNLFIYNVMIPKALKETKPPAATVSVAEAKPLTWTPGIEAVGTAKALRGVDVAAEVGGVVKAINFRANQKIEGGAVLVQLDDDVERADLIAAQANIRLYEAQFARTEELRRKGVASQSALDDARAQIDVAKSNYARLLATTEKKAITAAFSGTVGIERIDLGQYIEPGTVVATLQDLSRIKVDFTIPEQLASQIAIGRKVYFGENFNALDFDGQITGIDPKVDPQTRLVAVQAMLDNAGGRINPGQFLRVRVELPPKEGVIALPQSSVVPSLYGDYVYTALPDAPPAKGDDKNAAPDAPRTYTVKQVFVTLGRRSGSMVEIAEGLKAGDLVVVAGQNKLFPGAPVVIESGTAVEDMARKSAGEVE